VKKEVGGEGGRQLPHRDVDFPKTEPGLEPPSPRLQPNGFKEKPFLKWAERSFCLPRKGHHTFLQVTQVTPV